MRSSSRGAIRTGWAPAGGAPGSCRSVPGLPRGRDGCSSPRAGGFGYDIGRVGNWILGDAIHFFVLARWYFVRAGDPLYVYARASSKQAGHTELQDNFSAMLNFPGGAYEVISQSLGAFEHHQV